MRDLDWPDAFAAWLKRLPKPIESMTADEARDWLDEIIDLHRGPGGPPQSEAAPSEGAAPKDADKTNSPGDITPPEDSP